MYNDKQECLNAIRMNSFLDLAEIDLELLKDEDIIVEIIKRNQTRVNTFKDEMMNRKGLMDRVFNEIDSTLYHRLSDEIKNDAEFMRQLVDVDENAVYNLGQELMADFEYVKKIGKINSEVFVRLSKEDKNDPVKMQQIMLIEPENIKYASAELRESKEFVLGALDRTYADMYKYVSPKLKSDKDFVIEAAKKRPAILRHVDKELQDDSGVWVKVVEANDKNMEIFTTMLDDDGSSFDKIKNDSVFMEYYQSKQAKDRVYSKMATDAVNKKEEVENIKIEQVEQTDMALIPYNDKRKGLRGLVDRFKKFFSKKEKVEVAEVPEFEESATEEHDIIIPKEVKTSREAFVESLQVKKEDMLEIELGMMKETEQYLERNQIEQYDR